MTGRWLIAARALAAVSFVIPLVDGISVESVIAGTTNATFWYVAVWVAYFVAFRRRA